MHHLNPQVSVNRHHKDSSPAPQLVDAVERKPQHHKDAWSLHLTPLPLPSFVETPLVAPPSKESNFLSTGTNMMNLKKRRVADSLEVRSAADVKPLKPTITSTSDDALTKDYLNVTDVLDFDQTCDFLGLEELDVTFKVDTDHAINLKNGLAKMFQDQAYCDLVLRATCRDTGSVNEARVHLAVVACVSPTIRSLADQYPRCGVKVESGVSPVDPRSVFSTTSDGKMVIKLDQSHVEGAHLDDLIKYVYHGTVDIGHENATGLFSAACYLGIKGLMDICTEYLSANLDANNVLSVIQVANRAGQAPLEQTSLRFFARNFVAIIHSKEWANLSKPFLCKLLSQNDMLVPRELDVFVCLVEWAKKDLENRRTDFEELFLNTSVLRLPYMTRNDMIDVSKNPLVESSDVLRRALYDEAMRRVQNSPTGPGIAQRRYSLRDFPSVAKTCEKTLFGHTSPVCSLVVYHDYLISGSTEGHICIWDLCTYDCIQTLFGHRNSVVVLRCIGDFLVSGSPDKTIRVWNLNTFACEYELQGHTSAVCALAICGPMVCSGSDNGMIKVWNSETWECEMSIRAHTHVIWSLVNCADSQLVSGSSDTTIRVWDSVTWKCVAVLRQHKDEVQALVVHDNMLISGSDDGMIKVWDRHSWECLRSLEGHNRAVLSLTVSGNSIVSGLGNGHIKFWNLNTLECEDTLSEHTSCVMAIVPYREKIISGSYDRTIKLWGSGT